MVIHSPGRQRESLTFSSETYKALIRKYLDCMGYSQLTDAYVEGHLSDMIFINPNISVEKRTYVEAKATTISLADVDFSKELLQYFAEWLNLPANQRFAFFIFTKKIMNRKEMDKLFGAKYSVTALKAWMSKNKKHLSEDVKKIVQKAEFKEIVAFISNVEIYEMDINQLTAAIEEKSRHSDLSLEAYAKNLLTEVKRRGKPIHEKNNLIANLVPVDIPQKYSVVKVKFRTKDKLYEYFNKKDIEIPPLTFYPEKQTVSTFTDISKNNPFAEVMEGNVEEIKITDSTSEQFISALLNQHLRRIFWKKGLRRIKDTNIYFFECERVDDKFVKKLCLNSHGKDKEVTTPEYKEEEGELKLNFIFHHAVEAIPKKIWDKYYVCLIPKKEYSLDGVTPVESNLKDAIDRKFRNPLFNRSSNILSEIRFWHYFLFVSDTFIKPKEGWFNNFKFGNLENVPFGWKPQTVPLGQAVLEEY